MTERTQFYTAADLPLPEGFRGRRLRAVHPAITRAYGAGEYVGQESFVRASEVRALAAAMGVEAVSTVLDLCCGTGGLARHLAASFGCRVIGIDRSATAAGLAQRSAAHGSGPTRTSFLAADALRLPFTGPFDAVLLLETLLAIPDKAALLAEVQRVLRPMGRFGLTLEAGRPLDQVERQALGAGQLVWLVPVEAFIAQASKHRFRLIRQEDHTALHAATVQRLLRTYEQHRAELIAQIGRAPGERLIADHQAWAGWLADGRVRKFAMVFERVAKGTAGRRHGAPYVAAPQPM